MEPLYFKFIYLISKTSVRSCSVSYKLSLFISNNLLGLKHSGSRPIPWTLKDPEFKIFSHDSRFYYEWITSYYQLKQNNHAS